MMVGGFAATKAAAQNPDAIDNARSTAKSLQQQQANGSNAAPAPAKAKPAPGAPPPTVKPAAIPGAKSASAPAPAAKAASDSAQHNQLKHVNVAQGADTVQIEISSSQAVTPRVSKLSSPARVVVELPGTIVASSQNKIPVGSAGIKGVRIGMDGKTPPTTSVVVDLEKALAYELTPGPADKLILTLHTQAGAPTVAKNNPAPTPVKASTPVSQAKVTAAKPATAAAPKMAANAPAAPAPKVVGVAAPVSKAAATASKPDSKTQAKAAPAAKPAVPAVKQPVVAPVQAQAAKPKPEEKKWAMSGKRDPFFSPVVQQSGSGCSTGKKCLEIGAINLRGVVKSDSGFIAVVTNSLNKAYFLRENDPVFNGYVVKITGDSVVFQETIQDKLGKPFTREIVKRIFTPAV
jgi:Tfp pilus assembly protein PilP